MSPVPPSAAATLVPTMDQTTDLKTVPITDPTTDLKTVPTTVPTTVPYGNSTTQQAVPTYASSIKQGHVCCGCCCDVRRAVMILDILYVIFGIIALVLVPVAMNSDSDTVSNGLYIGTIVVLIIGIGFSFLGFYGAWKYNWQMVMASFIYLIVILVFQLISLNIVGAVVTVIVGYPHFFLINEIRNGIMSIETWPVEEKCCCENC